MTAAVAGLSGYDSTPTGFQISMLVMSSLLTGWLGSDLVSPFSKKPSVRALQGILPCNALIARPLDRE